MSFLYVKDNKALLVLSLPRYLADMVADKTGYNGWNSFTDFVGNIPKFTKFDELYIYKKNNTIEVPQLGLSSYLINYVSLSDILPD